MKKEQVIAVSQYHLKNVLALGKDVLDEIKTSGIKKSTVDFCKSLVTECERLLGEAKKFASDDKIQIEKDKNPVLVQLFEKKFEQSSNMAKVMAEINMQAPPDASDSLQLLKAARNEYDLAIQNLNYADEHHVTAAILNLTAAKMRYDFFQQEMKIASGIKVNPGAKELRQKLFEGGI